MGEIFSLTNVCATLGLLAFGCSEPRSIPRPELPLPREAQTTWVNDGDHELHAYASNIAFPDDFRIVVYEARMDGDTYRSVRIGRTWLEDDGWLDEPMNGSIAFTGGDDATLTVDFPDAPVSRFNGTYETFSARQRREIRETVERRRAEREARGEPAEVPAAERPPCRRYRDCVCTLSEQVRSPTNPFEEACSTAERLLVHAPDDPAACTTGLAMHRQLAPELGIALPEACR